MKQTISLSQALSDAFDALQAGKIAQARALAKRLESVRPEPDALPYLLGLIALEEGQARKAAQYLARALAKTPSAVPPLLAMARAQTMQSRWREAQEYYRALVCLVPDLAVAWRDLADIDLRQGDFSRAGSVLGPAAWLAPMDPTIRNNLGIAERARGRFDEAMEHFKYAAVIDPSLPKPYANLAGLRRHLRQSSASLAENAVRIAPDNGIFHLEWGQSLGDAPEALAALRDAARLLPGPIEPRWLLAERLRRDGHTEEAAIIYHDILRSDPDDSFGARIALAQMGESDLPDAAPPAQIRALYDQYAQEFDRDLLDKLDYRGPTILAQALQRLGIKGPLDIIDAGCGTGLAGLAIKHVARRLVGIDLSEKMAAQARLRGIYDMVLVGDLVPYLSGHPDTCDLVLAADVLIYQGDLGPVTHACSLALRSGGLFAFTVEHSNGAAVQLQKSGRFAHSRDHLSDIAARFGFDILLLESTATRREQGSLVASLLCVLRKP